MLAAINRVLADRRRLSRTVSELSALCDASLDDIGVRRHDIVRTARAACATSSFAASGRPGTVTATARTA